jgi:DNA repair exonuclease SbcCD ATPase subunit
LKFHLEDLVQHAIESMFPGKYQFRVVFDIARGRTSASMFLESEGQPLDPMDECGGTVVQVVAFALRVAAWTLAPTDNVILMDEPFAAVSSDFRAVCGELLSGLSKRLGIQFIVVASHESGQSYLVDYADRVFEVSQDKGGRSHVIVKEGKAE